MQSHPSWVCGLKPDTLLRSRFVLWSHPSWVCGLKQTDSYYLAIHVMSHPSWVCGLKLCFWYSFLHVFRVTPFVGVWIETPHLPRCHTIAMSHPSWVCGLKLVATLIALERIKSHPSWVCGLKQIVWGGVPCTFERHTLRGCVD